MLWSTLRVHAASYELARYRYLLSRLFGGASAIASLRRGTAQNNLFSQHFSSLPWHRPMPDGDARRRVWSDRSRTVVAAIRMTGQGCGPSQIEYNSVSAFVCPAPPQTALPPASTRLSRRGDWDLLRAAARSLTQSDKSTRTCMLFSMLKRLIRTAATLQVKRDRY